MLYDRHRASCDERQTGRLSVTSLHQPLQQGEHGTPTLPRRHLHPHAFQLVGRRNIQAPEVDHLGQVIAANLRQHPLVILRAGGIEGELSIRDSRIARTRRHQRTRHSLCSQQLSQPATRAAVIGKNQPAPGGNDRLLGHWRGLRDDDVLLQPRIAL